MRHAYLSIKGSSVLSGVWPGLVRGGSLVRLLAPVLIAGKGNNSH